MKITPPLLIFLLLLTFLMVGCAPSTTVPEPVAPDFGTLVCEVFYRPSPGSGMQSPPPLIFKGGNDSQSIQFDDLAFEARFQDDEFEGRTLSTIVTALETGVEISRVLYQFDPQNPVENQFIGGHGFTGLNYVFHPTTTAEIQYFCRVEYD